MTRWPTTLDSQVWATVSTPLATATAIMPPTSQASRALSFWGRAVSRMSRSRNGETIPRPAEMTISPSTAARRPRYGAKRPAIRLVKR